MLLAAGDGRRQGDVGDEVAGFEDGFAVGGIAGEEVEVGDGDIALALFAVDVDCGFEGDEGDGHVRGVRGDAVLAGAEDGEGAVGAGDCGAAGAGVAFVAREGGVAEVHAAGALEEVAGGGGHVAELARRRRRGWPAETRDSFAGRWGGGRGRSCGRWRRCLRPPSGVAFDFVEGEAVDVDEGAGSRR